MAPTFLSSMSEGFDLFINYLQELDGGRGRRGVEASLRFRVPLGGGGIALALR